MKLSRKLLFSIIFIMCLFFIAFSYNSKVNAASKKTFSDDGFYINLSDYSFQYTGKKIKPKVTMKNSTSNKTLKEGTDYTVSYKNNVSPGNLTASVTVTGKGNYTGSVSSCFTIYKYDISEAIVDDISDQTYTGKIIKPSIGTVEYKKGSKTITLKEGTDYTVSYSSYANDITPLGISYIYLNGKGDYDGTYKTLTFNVVPSKIKNVKTTLETTGINISWNKSSLDIDGYEIYRKTSTNKKYALVGTVDKDKSSYLDTTPATTGKTYYYKVRAYKYSSSTKLSGKFSSESSIIFAQGVTYTLTSTNDSAYLKWNSVNGADGYEIYRSANKNGNYVKIKSRSASKKCSYTDNVESYKTYYYKIRCYANTSSGKVYSQFTDIKKKTSLAKTIFKKANCTDSKITLTWNKVDSISGYKIYRATSENGKYSKIATISSKKTSYTDKNISLGKVYYYKIRCYKNKNDKTLYGDYSDIQKVVTGTRTQQLNKTKSTTDKEFKNSDFGSYYKDYQSLINKNTNSSMSKYTKVKTMYKYLVQHLYHKDGYNCKSFASTFCRNV